MGRKEAKALAFLAALPIIILIILIGIFSDNMVPVLFVYLLIMFFIPATATGWKSLAVRSGVILSPLLLLFVWDHSGEAGILLLVLIIPPLLGTLARVLSLLAEKLGHSRPKSLWIEALIFLAIVAYVVFAVVSRH